MLTVIGGNGASPGYNLTRSLRFRRASAYMDRTFGTPTNNKIWTWSGWIKRGLIGTNTQLIMNASANGDEAFRFKNDTFEIYFGLAGVNGLLITTQVFRDPASFYHLVVAVDTTQATASNRVKIYINGLQITSFSYEAYPVQNYNTSINAPGNNVISVGGSDSLDGYLAEINFIDGQARTPSSFGSNNTTTGVWQPVQYAGTYGANGFYLKFTDNSSLTTSSNVGLGKDFSGNGNYWRTVNISITYDSMTDVPTLTTDNTANYSTLNPLWRDFGDSTPGGVTGLSDANLSIFYNPSYWDGYRSTISVSSGKWYVEMDTSSGGTTPANCKLGFLNINTEVNTSAGVAEIAPASAGQTVAIALDLNAGTYTTYRANVVVATGSVTLGNTYCFRVRLGNAPIAYANFGQRPFAYTPPTGFKSLNAFNLPDSTIKKGNTVMDATVYTGIGTGGNLPVVNAAGFKPDLIWGKNRTTAGNWHVLVDSNRGNDKFSFSNNSNAEGASGTPVFSINSNGFTASYNNANMNELNSSIVAWQWQAGQGTNVTNTNGSITSTVSVNASAGFSVVTYTGTGATATVGHGLGVAPKFIIFKKRSAAENWMCVHTSLTNYNWYLILNSSSAQIGDITIGNIDPTSTRFEVGTSPLDNTSGATYVAYCWAPIAGYSAFSSYTGNGSTDGTFVYTGFRPKLVMIKEITSGGTNWNILDTSRDPYNVEQKYIAANLDAAEGTLALLDGLSNGFKLRSSALAVNASGSTYIYMAFAENPFKNSLAR